MNDDLYGKHNREKLTLDYEMLRSDYLIEFITGRGFIRRNPDCSEEFI